MLAQPIKAPTGGRYGAAQELQQAQQAVPMAQQAPAGQPNMQDVLAQAQAFEMPVGLAAPTERPDEPITAGMDMGPGPGSEILESPGPDGLLIRGIAALQALGDDLDPATKRVLQEAQITLANRGRY
jgi:hypothetical protein